MYIFLFHISVYKKITILVENFEGTHDFKLVYNFFE